MRVGQRVRQLGLPRTLVGVFLAALAARLLMLPLMHPWDGNTFHNLFAQLAAGENPYETFRVLSLEARTRIGPGHAQWYEYFAYPPLLLYLYAPLAKLTALFVPLQTHFYLPATALVPNTFPLAFLLAYKLPIWLADFAIGAMLWARTRRVSLVALYLLNPLVLLVSGAWMFDAIPVAFTLGALLAFERERIALAGALLALGFLAKFYPLFLLPVFAMALVWRRDARVFRLLGSFVAVSVALVAPWWPDVANAFAFNSARSGGGLTLHQVWLSRLWLAEADPFPFQEIVSPAVGAVVLLGALGAAYILIDLRRPPLTHAIAITLVALLLGTKVVNEQYALWLLPFLILLLAQPMPRALHLRVAFHLAWLVPFAYALVHVPAPALLPGGHAWAAALLADKAFHYRAAAFAALAFVATLAYALWALLPAAPRPPPARPLTEEVPA